ncbi:MAG: twin transmembrane helix small protein [Burkholderiales bacterium]|nr:twin transmembrane helix small protein [Burkholderiales bacterium]
MKVLVILFLVVILGSLGSALYYLVRDRGQSDRTARALTWRIALSIGLFILLMAGYMTGIIPRSGL